MLKAAIRMRIHSSEYMPADPVSNMTTMAKKDTKKKAPQLDGRV